MTDTATVSSTPRIGARVLLLDPRDRVLLIHARDPEAPDHQWWETPGGGVDPGESLVETAVREVAEETGLLITSEDVGPCLWVRETRFVYRGQRHHRREHVYLARVRDTRPVRQPKKTANEQLGLLGQRWWTHSELVATTDKLLPPALPDLLPRVLAGEITTPLALDE